MFLIGSKKKKKGDFLKYFGWYTVKISRVVFNVSLITFIFYFALENFKTGLISNYFDMNLLLVSAIFSGIIILIFQEKKAKKNHKTFYYLISIIFAILLALFTFQYTSQLGIIGLLATGIAAFASFIILSLFNRKI